MGKLTDLKVRAAKFPTTVSRLGNVRTAPVRFGDGRGLYLVVKKPNSRGVSAKSWVLLVQRDGRREEIGLGGYPETTLNMARDKALILRRAAKEGESPRAVRDAKRQRVHTFAEVVGEAHRELSKGWADKQGKAFLASLQTHIVPRIGNQPVDRIGAEQVVVALSPVWTTKPEVARKLRIRIVQVLAFAKARGWRKDGPPTAAELKAGLAVQPRGKNFAAMPYVDVPKFFAAQLDKTHTAGRLALLFAIVTAARSGEVRHATWEQIDEEARTWTRPAEIMKTRQPHVVVLSDAALDILARAKALWGRTGFLFPSPRGNALSDMALSKLLRDGGEKVTAHGFRSSFRDWGAERTSFPRELLELSLAHVVGNATERAYQRSDLREKRRPVMESWGRFVAPSLSGSNSNVIEISGGAQAA